MSTTPTVSLEEMIAHARECVQLSEKINGVPGARLNFINSTAASYNYHRLELERAILATLEAMRDDLK